MTTTEQITVAQLIARLQTLPQDAIIESFNECGDSRKVAIDGIYCIDWSAETFRGSLRFGQKVVFIEA